MRFFWVFTFRDLTLAGLAGLIFGVWFGARHRSEPKDAPFARVIGAFGEPITYWLNLGGSDGRPSFTKIVYAVVLVAAVYGMVVLGQVEVHREKYEGLSWGYDAYVLMVLMYGLGRQAFVGAFDKVEAYIAGKWGGERAVMARQSEAVKARESGAIPRPPEAGA